MKKYTRLQIEEMWNKVKQNPDFIFRNEEDFLNYSGNLKNETVSYSEYISQLILNDFSILKAIGKDKSIIRSSKSYNRNHNGISDVSRRKKRFGYIRFNEVPFSIALYNSHREYPFGKIIDYNTPLSESRRPNIGRIDLIGKNNNDIFLIELKTNSIETLLRAILEIFSFSIFLNVRMDKFCNDFNLPYKIKLIPTILLYNSINCEEQLKSIKNNELPYFKRLLESMNQYFQSLKIEPFRFFILNIDEPILDLDDKSRIIIIGKGIDSKDIDEYFIIP